MMHASSTGRIVSLNVGAPREILVNGRSVRTAIFKYPVEGRIALRGYNLAGDAQADSRVHGGPYKAVYLYPSEHYPYWKDQFSLPELPFGAFGENITSEGLLEEAVCIGDQFRVGSAILQVSQPRMPCFKLALRFEKPDMVKRFWQSGRSGIYFSVVAEGEMERGDAIEKISEHRERVTVADIVRLYKGEEWNPEVLKRALRSPLFGSWKRDIQSRLLENA
jgi:MOSC domain-containing protein YiiM